VPAAQRARLVAERDGAPVLAALRAEPGASKTALARRLAIARATLAWHLGRLERAGLVRCERDGREVRVFPVDRQETFS
jgi:predicted transcriptional regulator